MSLVLFGVDSGVLRLSFLIFVVILKQDVKRTGENWAALVNFFVAAKL